MSTDPGILLVLAGPSGTGKTTLSRRIVDGTPGMSFSVSATTRPPRGSETDGVDYEFVNDAEFDRRIGAGFFLEWAEVLGRRYGTSADAVRRALSAGSGIVLDIDVQGALRVKDIVPGAVLVFVLPPSPRQLEDRLDGRGTEGGEGVALRLAAAASEVRWCGSFDYAVVNDDLDRAAAQIESIIAAERLRLSTRAYPPEAREFDRCLLDECGFWRGRRVVVTAGPTREPLDDVRFLSNRSSGRMGSEMAAAFRDMGASVVLLHGPGAFPVPPGVEAEPFETAADLELALARRAADGQDLIAMAAAVADFRPAERREGKIRRGPSGFSLDLEAVPDILAALDADCPILAFSLEFGPDSLERAAAKLEGKHSFAIFCNRGDVPGIGMESQGNRGVVLFADGTSEEIPFSSKRFAALALAAAIGRHLAKN